MPTEIFGKRNTRNMFKDVSEKIKEGNFLEALRVDELY
jgi:hypothetical protein